LPKGTAYQTDIRMTGPYDSVIGVEKQLILHRFLTQMPIRFEPAKNDARFAATIIDCDPATGHASAIERIFLKE